MPVQTFDEVRHPPDARLQERHPQTGMPFENSASGERGHRDHLVIREADGMDLQVNVEAIAAELGQVHAGRAMRGHWQVGVLRRLVHGVELRGIQISRPRRRRDDAGDEAECLRFLDYLRGVLGEVDGDHGHPVEPARRRGAVPGYPFVVHSRDPGRKVTINNTQREIAEARVEHHLVNAVAVGVGEHPRDMVGVGIGAIHESVVRMRTRARPAYLRIRAALDDDAENSVGTHGDLVGPALHRTGNKTYAFLAPDQDVSIGIDYLHRITSFR